MEMTFDIPEELARKIQPIQDQIVEIIESGLRLRGAGPGEYADLDSALSTLVSSSTPQEVIALRPSARLQERLAELLAKSATPGLTPDEQREWEAYEYVEHLVRIAKARAAMRLKQAS